MCVKLYPFICCVEIPDPFVEAVIIFGDPDTGLVNTEPFKFEILTRPEWSLWRQCLDH